jgi:hypothetical protein
MTRKELKQLIRETIEEMNTPAKPRLTLKRASSGDPNEMDVYVGKDLIATVRDDRSRQFEFTLAQGGPRYHLYGDSIKDVAKSLHDDAIFTNGKWMVPLAPGDKTGYEDEDYEEDVRDIGYDKREPEEGS